MPCSICLERFTSPVSLPCGHVFCRACLRRTVLAAASKSLPARPQTQQPCPSCRSPYSVVSIDPALVPPYLRPHILPPIRPVYFDDAPTPSEAGSQSQSQSQSQAAVSPSSSLATTPPTSPPPAFISLNSPSSPSGSFSAASASSQSQPLPAPVVANPGGSGSAPAGSSTSASAATAAPPNATLQTELIALRTALAASQRLAQTHATAATQLLAFARTTRAAAWRMRAERDAARNRAELLGMQLRTALESQSTTGKRRASEVDLDPQVPVPAACLKRSLPVFVTHGHGRDLRAEASLPEQPSLLGPPLKRRRTTPVGVSTSDWTEPSFFARGASSLVEAH